MLFVLYVYLWWLQGKVYTNAHTMLRLTNTQYFATLWEGLSFFNKCTYPTCPTCATDYV